MPCPRARGAVVAVWGCSKECRLSWKPGSCWQVCLAACQDILLRVCRPLCCLRVGLRQHRWTHPVCGFMAHWNASSVCLLLHDHESGGRFCTVSRFFSLTHSLKCPTSSSSSCGSSTSRRSAPTWARPPLQGGKQKQRNQDLQIQTQTCVIIESEDSQIKVRMMKKAPRSIGVALGRFCSLYHTLFKSSSASSLGSILVSRNVGMHS